jgi:hypothetical protein
MIIPFPMRTASNHQHDIEAALIRQLAAERARVLLAEAAPQDDLAQRLNSIEAKLDTLLSKQKRRAS